MFGHEGRCDPPLPQEAANVIQCQVLTGLGLYEGARPFAEPRIRHAHDRYEMYGRMFVEQCLNLDDRDVLATTDDDILRTTGDADVPV